LFCASILKIGNDGSDAGPALWKHDLKRVNFASNVMKLGEVNIMNFSMIEQNKKVEGFAGTSLRFYNVVI
jgi:hypothetical protein